jgi:hypothetical protein
MNPVRYQLPHRRFLPLIVCLSATCGYALSAHARPLAEIQQSKELRVCMAFEAH